MARKRGGLAGLYDRNKKYIKTLAPIAAGFVPGVGPALGAALGAAMGGDTEGKGYFSGFNTAGAVKGGISGYGGAKLGQAAKSRVSKMLTASPLDKLTGAPSVGLTAGAPSSYGASGSFQPSLTGSAPSTGMLSGASAPAAAYKGNVGGYGIGMPVGSAPPVPPSAMTDLPDITGIGSKYVTPMNQPLQMKPQAVFGASPSSLPREIPGGGLRKMASDAFGEGGYIQRNERMLGGVAKGIGSVLGGRAEAGALESKTELERQKFEYEKEQQAAEEERRRRMAELLMPLFAQMQGRQSYGG